jgi:hypothetical protein
MSIEEILFWFASVYILPFWIAMWFFPKHEITEKMLNNPLICIAPLLGAYTILVLPELPELIITFSSQMVTPEVVKELFENEATIYLGWIHFLALDLLAARWLWNQFRTSDLQVYVTFPILFLCMMVAPFGVLLGMATLKAKGELEMMANETSLN